MQDAISQLMGDGSQNVADWFRQAKHFWDEFFKEHREDSETDLASAIRGAQWSYELLFQMDRGLAKETMPFTCFGALYDLRAGWEDDRPFAVRVAYAFLASGASSEVKFSAVEAIAIYSLHDNEPDLAAKVRQHFRL